MSNNLLEGSWTYRSFNNNPQPVGDDPNRALQLIFGEGEIRFTLNRRAKESKAMASSPR